MVEKKLKKTVAIIGGGAAAMMLACSLDRSKFIVSIYEKNKSLGRKFLVAGDGGFNLTHSENINRFCERYRNAAFIKPFLKHFSNTDCIHWLNTIGIETFVGSSKRVFPVKGIKPIQVLKSIEKKIAENEVTLFYKHEWKGWKGDDLLFINEGIIKEVKHDITVFALGGASWNVTGSDGRWIDLFAQKGIATVPFSPSNCAFKVDWKPEFIKDNDGKALKNAAFRCDDKMQKGEAVITQFGIEGSGVYPLSENIRKQLTAHQKAIIHVDFKLELTEKQLVDILKNEPKLSIKDVLLKRIKLSKTQFELIKNYTSKEEYHSPQFVANYIKHFPIHIAGLGDIDEAISTTGGISLTEVTTHLACKNIANTYFMGEMLDWDAPTGGYLLQACFSMGNYLASHLNEGES
jgi:uncharacterized flavoprotein (TIGR03862 family)